MPLVVPGNEVPPPPPPTSLCDSVVRTLAASNGSAASATPMGEPSGSPPTKLSRAVPVSKAYRCTYVLRYLDVAHAYQLSISRADVRSIRYSAS
jgi:hypothetical protein